MATSNKSKKNKVVLFSAVGAILALVLAFFMIVSINTSPVSKTTEEVAFEVVQGDNMNTILARLEEEGIIKSATFTKVSAKLKGIENFVAGQFKVDKNWNSTDILSYFTKQDNVLKDEVMLTFREGIWAKDIAEILSSNINYTTEDIIAKWNDSSFLNTCISKYEFLDESILNNNYRIKLEGYLFPETYSIPKKATIEEVTYIFLDHFDAVYQSLKKDIASSDLTVHELVSLASVVQYESATTKDMEMIAGVFNNRLSINMPLQSSVTVCYAIYEFENWEDCEIKTNIDSVYNTYLHNGLPYGPILNPGKEALKATLHPTSHEYLFFIADINNVKGEGAGTVYYSKNVNEHYQLQSELGLTW